MHRLAAAPARPEPLRPEQVTGLLGAAGAAPSIHNTQPWRFTVHDRTIEVYEDPRRALPVHDPAGRQRLLSCGAAVTNLVAAALRLGLDPRVDSLPAGGPPGLLARVRLVDVAVAPGLHRGLADAATYRAIFTRRTHRREFAHQPLSESDRAALAAAATGPGVRWRWLSAPETRHALELTRRAAALQRGDPAYRVELGRWLRYDAALPGDTRHRGHEHPVGFGDGIPVAALAPRWRRSRLVTCRSTAGRSIRCPCCRPMRRTCPASARWPSSPRRGTTGGVGCPPAGSCSTPC